MSSREIAELTAKEHKNVLADIRVMLDQLELTSADFSADLPDGYGRLQPGFALPKDLTITLVAGYSAPLRHRIVKRWLEMEAAVAAPPRTLTPAEMFLQNAQAMVDLERWRGTGHGGDGGAAAERLSAPGSPSEPPKPQHGGMNASTEHLTPLPSTRLDNGILARVNAEYVGKAQSALPDAALAPDDEIRVDVDAGWLGRVRLTFRKYRYSRPKGKFSAVAWSCRHAEPISDAESP